MTNDSSLLADFAARFRYCWLCGQSDAATCYPLQIHHICRGPHRKASREAECSLIRTCCSCHDAVLDAMSVARQIALVALYNPAAYDRVMVNVMRHRAPESVSEREVLQEITYWLNQKGVRLC
jgi:hypothetical protein